MTVSLVHNNYGKSRVRLLRVTRGENQHEIKDLTFWIQFEGDFEAVHTAGDNRKVLTTDTMKNTVYVLAKQYPAEPIEDFSMHLIEHFLTYNPQVSKVRVVAAEKYWNRVPVGGGSHRSAFTGAGNERRMSEIEGGRGGYTIRAGIEDLIVLKTAKSAFEGFLRDPYTTLEDTRDRVLSTNLRAHWLYQGDEIPFSPTWHGVRQVLINTFADHDSQSLQHTLYAMGEAVLKSFDAIREIQFSLPNQHYNLVDLKPFGLENDNEVFLPTDEPYGLIEATLKKGN
ncbi:MAG: urate oxidase [Candidatus Acidiferrales bacterium]